MIEQLPQEMVPTSYDKYIPIHEEGMFINKVLDDYQKDYELKNQSQPLLSKRTLKQFWDQSNKDYLQFLEETKLDDDWIREYPSGMARDKVNSFISALVQKMIKAQITAQNKNQIIDRVLSRVTRTLVDYAIQNDGHPFDSGHSKFVRAVHKCVVEGTLHKLNFINEDKEHESVIIPNEEVFIPNFFQFDLQKQSHFLWIQDNITYEEAKMEFGDFKNFDYVVPGVQYQYNPSGAFSKDDGRHTRSIVPEKKCQVIRCWYQVLKDKLPSGKKRAKYFNILVNGIPMLPYDNIDIYNHGYFPISKTIFELFDSHYYWGNNVANKIRHDKKWATALRTIILNKGKLAMMPPQFAEDGLNIDQNVYVPAKITSISGKASQIQPVPGITPISQGEVALLNMVQRSADEGSVAPLSQGLPSTEQRTLGEIQLQEANATKMMSTFGLMIAFGVEQDTWFVINNIYQFYPRKKINELAKISIPNQKLGSGRTGTMEIIFENIMNLSEVERQKKSREIEIEVLKSAKRGIHKEINYIDPSYAKNIKWFINVDGNPVSRRSEEMESYLAVARYKEIHLNNPNINQVEATRIAVRATTPDEEDSLVIDTEAPEMPMSLASPRAGPEIPETPSPSIRMPNQLKGALSPA